MNIDPVRLLRHLPPEVPLVCALKPVRLSLPMAPGRVAAGFPSPAEDFTERRHDLNELLVRHPTATFFWLVSGMSMVEAGIGDGDILVVDRSLKGEHGDIVIAQVDHEFVCKQLCLRTKRLRLLPANPTYPEIVPREGQTVQIVGVVTSCIRRFVRGDSRRRG